MLTDTQIIGFNRIGKATLTVRGARLFQYMKSLTVLEELLMHAEREQEIEVLNASISKLKSLIGEMGAHNC